jgi:AcrR family transcriptional regulator
MSPRTSDQFEKMREDKITLIMDAALEHFANLGYHATTISHIAKHAGISKGLMYNYFESKEALLKAIMHKSVNEVYKYLDIDRDGCLSENKFEFFIRKIDILLKEKRYFFQLLMQLIMQNDVREQYLKALHETDSLVHPGHEPGDNYYPLQILKMFRDYFVSKKEKMGELSDPDRDFEMFFITLLGYAIKAIHSESTDQESDTKIINRIIEIFK